MLDFWISWAIWQLPPAQNQNDDAFGCKPIPLWNMATCLPLLCECRLVSTFPKSLDRHTWPSKPKDAMSSLPWSHRRVTIVSSAAELGRQSQPGFGRYINRGKTGESPLVRLNGSLAKVSGCLGYMAFACYILCTTQSCLSLFVPAFIPVWHLHALHIMMSRVK